MTPAGAVDKSFELSSPANGIQFNILGENSPVPGQKVQISWIENPDYMFLALPKNGQVQGIDQLFGNNTQGPDGRFASNGYDALAKYDKNHDGLIDANDPIFSSLRLWSDRNHDGVAQPEELITLKEAGIESINLHYVKSFNETDQYGNEIRFRSEAQSLEGSRAMFDVWFALP